MKTIIALFIFSLSISTAYCQDAKTGKSKGKKNSPEVTAITPSSGAAGSIGRIEALPTSVAIDSATFASFATNAAPVWMFDSALTLRNLPDTVYCLVLAEAIFDNAFIALIDSLGFRSATESEIAYTSLAYGRSPSYSKSAFFTYRSICTIGVVYPFKGEMKYGYFRYNLGGVMSAGAHFLCVKK